MATDAMNGMNPTEVLTRANGILKKNESLMMLRSANAAKAFQKREGKGPGLCQGAEKRITADAAVTAAMRT